MLIIKAKALAVVAHLANSPEMTASLTTLKRVVRNVKDWNCLLEDMKTAKMILEVTAPGYDREFALVDFECKIDPWRL